MQIKLWLAMGLSTMFLAIGKILAELTKLNLRASLELSEYVIRSDNAKR